MITALIIFIGMSVSYQIGVHNGEKEIKLPAPKHTSVKIQKIETVELNNAKNNE